MGSSVELSRILSTCSPPAGVGRERKSVSQSPKPISRPAMSLIIICAAELPNLSLGFNVNRVLKIDPSHYFAGLVRNLDPMLQVQVPLYYLGTGHVACLRDSALTSCMQIGELLPLLVAGDSVIIQVKEKGLHRWRQRSAASEVALLNLD
jgi:hypothetical protein